MATIFSSTTLLGLTFFLFLSNCTIKPADKTGPDNINPDTSSSRIQQLDAPKNPKEQKVDLEKIYSQAIGDYIRHVYKEYKITFDTLYFGKRVFGQPDDFPDIELPTYIENTTIKLITPEQGEKNQEERDSSFYINLIGSTGADNADFIFVTFSNGFAHQFDFFIDYKYDPDEKRFVIETTRFENYRYKKK